MIIYRYFLWFILYSFIGWVYETLLCSVTGKKFVNRGFLHGPVCPVYGFGAILLIAVLYGRIDNPVQLFAFGMILTTIVEYITGWLMETLFHKKWWDYSKCKFNIHGRVCMLGSVVFGAMAVLLITYVHPYVISLTSSLNSQIEHTISIMLLIILFVDLVLTISKLRSNKIITQSKNYIDELKLHFIR